MKRETINLTPTWSGLTPWMLNALSDPKLDYIARTNFTLELVKLGPMVQKYLSTAIDCKAPSHQREIARKAIIKAARDADR